jgi:hypothetical protein
LVGDLFGKKLDPVHGGNFEGRIGNVEFNLRRVRPAILSSAA